MIINYFYTIGIIILPTETNAVLVIYPDRILIFPVAGQFFEVIGRRNFEIIKFP